MSRFKVGDNVTVADRSWGRDLADEHSCYIRRCCGNKLREFKVLGVDCVVPVDSPTRVANTLIARERFSGGLVIYAINECNIRRCWVNVGVRFTSAGRDVTAKLSDESKREILQAHLRGPQ